MLPVNDCTIILEDLFELSTVCCFDDRNDFILNHPCITAAIHPALGSKSHSISTSTILKGTKYFKS